MISNNAQQYNNSGKYTTYMHIPIGHNLLPLFAFFKEEEVMEEKKIGGFSSLWLKNFHFHPWCTP